MKTTQDVLKKLTELYDKAIQANELDLAYRILTTAAGIVS